MKLFWYNIKGMDAAAYDAALSLMDAERQSRVKDFPNEDDRKRSAAGERYIPDFTQFDTVNLGEEKSMQTTIQLLSPMEKVMAQEEKTFAPYPKASALRGEETAFQAIVTGEGEH